MTTRGEPREVTASPGSLAPVRAAAVAAAAGVGDVARLGARLGAGHRPDQGELDLVGVAADQHAAG